MGRLDVGHCCDAVVTAGESGCWSLSVSCAVLILTAAAGLRSSSHVVVCATGASGTTVRSPASLLVLMRKGGVWKLVD